MKRTWIVVPALLLFIACSRLPTLTPQILMDAEARWNAHRPPSYRLIVEMSGDRVEAGHFELEVSGSNIVSLRRNGLVVRAGAGQDYTMEGLYRMLQQELSLAEKPAMLGAPPGYAVYVTAKFDDDTGRLIRYRRIVGGTSNTINVEVSDFAALK